MTPRFLALIPLAVGINLAMGIIVGASGLPLYLDTIGTVMVAALAGPAAAVTTGVLSQLVFTVYSGNGMWLTFLPVQLIVALYASWVAGRGGFATKSRAVAWGVALGCVAATASWPISYFFWGGVTASGVTWVVMVLRVVGAPLGIAVYVASIGSDVLDKTVTFLIVQALLTALPNRVVARFPNCTRALGREV